MFTIPRADWPYADRVLATPHCPLCGWPAVIFAAPNVEPIALCALDECPMFKYDPSQPAVEVLTDARRLVEQEGPDGSTLWRPAPE